MIKPHPLKLPPASLYTNDLHFINDKLSTISAHIYYSIKGDTEDMEYDSLHELLIAHNDESFSSLTIITRFRGITINIYPNSIIIRYDNGDDYEVRGIVEDIRKRLIKNSSIFQKARSSRAFPLIIAFAISLIIVQTFTTALRWEFFASYVLIGTFMLFAWIWILLGNLINFKTIHIKDKPNYHIYENILKNPSGLIGPTIAAIISGIIVYILDRL